MLLFALEMAPPHRGKVKAYLTWHTKLCLPSAFISNEALAVPMVSLRTNDTNSSSFLNLIQFVAYTTYLPSPSLPHSHIPWRRQIRAPAQGPVTIRLISHIRSGSRQGQRCNAGHETKGESTGKLLRKIHTQEETISFSFGHCART